jgi:hypothetical protein
MQSRGARIGLLAVLAAVAVVLFVVLSGGDDDGGDGDGTTTAATTGTSTAAEPAFEVIRIADGAPVGGPRELDYEKGDRIRIKVIPEPGIEEIHLHGYEIEKEPEGTKPVIFDFNADLAGGFEMEAHGAEGDFELAGIQVQP